MEQLQTSPVHLKRRMPAAVLFFLLFGLILISAWTLSANRLDNRNQAATINRGVALPAKGEPHKPVPEGCYEQQVQCFKAPCDPIVVCPSPSPVACDGPDGSRCTASSCPRCDGRRCPMVACVETEGTCVNNVCLQNPVAIPVSSLTPQPTNAPVRCDGTDGTSCELTTACPVCKPGQPCPAIACDPQEGTCINNQCVVSPAPTAYATRPPTPTPTVSKSPRPSPSSTPAPTVSPRPPTPTPIPPRVIVGNRRGALRNILRFLFPFLSPVLLE